MSLNKPIAINLVSLDSLQPWDGKKLRLPQKLRNCSGLKIRCIVSEAKLGGFSKIKVMTWEFPVFTSEWDKIAQFLTYENAQWNVSFHGNANSYMILQMKCYLEAMHVRVDQPINIRYFSGKI